MCEFLPFQSQTVAYHADTAHGHGGSGYHRIQQEAVDGVQNTGGYRDTYQVVDEGPEKILADGAYGGLRKADGIGNLVQVGRNERHFGHVHGNVASFSHGNAEIGLSQCRTVIDAVAHHGYDFAFLLQVLDELGFLLWEHFGLKVGNAALCCNPLGRFRIVTGQHIS